MGLDSNVHATDSNKQGSSFKNASDLEVMEYVQEMVTALENICLVRELNVMHSCLRFARMESERFIKHHD